MIKLTSLYINYTERVLGRKVRGQSYWGHPSETSSRVQGFDLGQCKIKKNYKILRILHVAEMEAAWRKVNAVAL